MARIELEFDDKGEVVGKLPAELDALFKRTETTSYGTGLKKGREDAIAETAKEIEARLAAEREKFEKDLGRVKQLEEENLGFRESEATLVKRFNETSRAREENHAKEIATKADLLTKHQRKLTDMLKAQIRTDALEAGARAESLSELEVILGAAIGFDDQLEIIVKDETGKPLTKQGKPVSTKDFVADYLNTHAHHKKPNGGVGGGARGGATYSGNHVVPSEAAAIDRIHSGDRTAGAIDALFQATRKLKAS